MFENSWVDNPLLRPVNEEYSISYANSKDIIWATQIIAAAKKAGLAEIAKNLETLQRSGTKYSYQDFDMLSYAMDELNKKGVTKDDVLKFPRTGK